jgi:hypothetical protein
MAAMRCPHCGRRAISKYQCQNCGYVPQSGRSDTGFNTVSGRDCRNGPVPGFVPRHDRATAAENQAEIGALRLDEKLPLPPVQQGSSPVRRVFFRFQPVAHVAEDVAVVFGVTGDNLGPEPGEDEGEI